MNQPVSIRGLRVPGTVLLLGITSFLNDFSSEMIYPLLPVFLSAVLGAGAISLGVIEGFAESVASILKLISGIWADRVPRRKPLVIAGYTISGILRPLIGLALSWPVVLVFRVGDRVGKGVRTSPRDALIADVTDVDQRGIAFGIQRGLDHAGAVIGPLVAAGLLLLGLSLRSVFLLAFVPAVFIVGLLAFGLREKAREVSRRDSRGVLPHWSELDGGFRRMLVAVCIFTLGNSTDAFLLLRLSDAGVQAGWIATLWSLHHVVKMVATTIGGWLSDRIGRRPTLISGWVLYAAIYLAFGLVGSTGWLIAIFLLYGLYFGFAEPTERAWVADLAPEGRRAEAFGWYNGAVGIAALPASVIFGAIWSLWGPAAAFGTGAFLALAAALILPTVPRKWSPTG